MARGFVTLVLVLGCAHVGGDAGLAVASPRGAGVLRVGTSGDYPPFSTLADPDPDPEPAEEPEPAAEPEPNPNPIREADPPALARHRGFAVELAERIARDLGLGVEWVPFRWPELEARVAADAFDVVASGVTWRPSRAVTGWMTRATAVGGPCVVGAGTPARVAVNRGGVLEQFARARFGDAEILALDDNLALGAALTQRRVEALVTDSFERSHLRVPIGTPYACEPKTDRKVLWIAPAQAAALGPRVDTWLATHDDVVDELRARWLGGSAPRTEADHLLDLLARRLAYMPAVAAWKRAHAIAITDPAREAAVLDAAREEARRAGLAADPVAALFAVQIELGKRVQADAARAQPGETLDLGAEIRPELVRLGARIIAAAARVAPLDEAALDAADWTPLEAWLGAPERALLRAALLAVAPAERQPGSAD